MSNYFLKSFYNRIHISCSFSACVYYYYKKGFRGDSVNGEKNDEKEEFSEIRLNANISLNAPKKLLTFSKNYGDFEKPHCKSIAYLGFDLCSIASQIIGSESSNKEFASLTGIDLTEDLLQNSDFSSVESKLFGTVDERAAIYSLGSLLSELMKKTPDNSFNLKKILQKATQMNFYERYKTFAEMQNDISEYLKSDIDCEKYGVLIIEPTVAKVAENTNPDSNAFSESASINFDSVLFTPNIGNGEIPKKSKIKKIFSFSNIRIAIIIAALLFSAVSFLKVYSEEKYLSDRFIPTQAYYEKQN